MVSGDPPPLREGCLAVSISICPLRSSTMLSSFRSRFISSISRSLVCFGGAFGSFTRGLRGARPGAGKTHWMWALRQLPHGINLSHLTFRRRHVTQLRGFSADEGVADGSSVMGPEGAKAELGGPALGAAGVTLAAGAESCGVDAAAGELFELSFGDEKDGDSMGVGLVWITETEEALDIVRAIRGQHSKL